MISYCLPLVHAVNGQDYSPVVDPLELLFVAAVAGQGSTACANISIFDDLALEGPHNFSVTLADFDLFVGVPDTARIFMGTPSSASVVIEDNEGEQTQGLHRSL